MPPSLRTIVNKHTWGRAGGTIRKRPHLDGAKREMRVSPGSDYSDLGLIIGREDPGTLRVENKGRFSAQLSKFLIPAAE